MRQNLMSGPRRQNLPSGDILRACLWLEEARNSVPYIGLRSCHAVCNPSVNRSSLRCRKSRPYPEFRVMWSCRPVEAGRRVGNIGTDSKIGGNPAMDLIRRARARLLRMHYESGVGHIGGNLSALDLLVVLHHEALRPSDQFVLSNGHAAGALDVTLCTLGRLTD